HVRINPNVIFKGAYQQRMSILLTYAKAGEPKVEVNKAQSADQKIDEIVKEMRNVSRMTGMDSDTLQEIFIRRLNNKKPDA
ncbi:replication/maintenance protein RepL, partial [Helicobacter pylori]|uniref:replication/maintenance protein RepL n=1 Tax=Helicobacter pylori TaxID=210 RepID=UPI001C7D3B74